VGNQLPILVQFDPDPDEGFAHALGMKSQVMPTNEMAETPCTVARGGIAMNMACFCPVPLAWAPYFLDFKSPHDALRMKEIS
jgi:hypothetical protein